MLNSMYDYEPKQKFDEVAHKLNETIDIGIVVLHELAKQRDQLHRTSRCVTDTNYTLDLSGFLLRGMKSFYGVVNSFQRATHDPEDQIEIIIHKTDEPVESDRHETELDRILKLAKVVHQIGKDISSELDEQNRIIPNIDDRVVRTIERLKKQLETVETIL